MGQLSEALPEVQQALTIHERLVRENPGTGLYQSEAATCSMFASLLNLMGRDPEARREYQVALSRFEGLRNPRLTDLYNIGCARARLAALGRPAGRTPTPEEESDARAHADLAVAAAPGRHGRVQKPHQPAHRPRPRAAAVAIRLPRAPARRGLPRRPVHADNGLVSGRAATMTHCEADATQPCPGAMSRRSREAPASAPFGAESARVGDGLRSPLVFVRLIPERRVRGA